MAYALSTNSTSPKRQRATARFVLNNMRDRGLALHLHFDRRIGSIWSLSNGRRIENHIAEQVLRSPSVVAAGDSLFCDGPSESIAGLTPTA